MSEKLHQQSPERQHSPEAKDTKLEKDNLKELQEKAKNTNEVSKDTIESIKKSIETSAISKDEYGTGAEKSKQPARSYGNTKTVKQNAYKKVLKDTRKHLSTPEKTFSKVIHNPTVERASEVGAKTIARPTGILFGGIVAFIGSLLLIILSKRSGFSYNYLIFIIIFIGGYIVGLIAELFYRTVTPTKK